ncbi:MAG: hemE [Hyphomicrobiales bacterium]|nr:hemE [Hyphomicrobiales bacterium]
MPHSANQKIFLQTLDGVATSTPPLWMMRQAGRYLPEYRAIRASVPTFLDFCYSPKLATEATLQPIKRFGFDAAILFSDILVVPDALGQKVSFEQGEGPRLPPIESAEDLAKLRTEIDLRKLEPVFETIDRVKSDLPADVALIGFCGAPWTVASYMIAGRGTPDQRPARLFAYREPELFQKLIDLLVESSIAYLERQFIAGVEVVQIFDSWAGVLPALEFERWCLRPLLAIVDGVKARVPLARIIAFPRGVGSHLTAFTGHPGINALGLDTATDPVWAASHVQPFKPVQGNLDPLALIAGNQALDRSVDLIKSAFKGRPYVFNLGHGILPETPIAHVEQLVNRVRSS